MGALRPPLVAFGGPLWPLKWLHRVLPRAHACWGIAYLGTVQARALVAREAENQRWVKWAAACTEVESRITARLGR